MTTDEARKILGDDSANVSDEVIQKEIETAELFKNIFFSFSPKSKWYNNSMKSYKITLKTGESAIMDTNSRD